MEFKRLKQTNGYNKAERLIENKLVVTGVERREGRCKIGVCYVEIWTPVHKTDKQQGETAQHRETVIILQL